MSPAAVAASCLLALGIAVLGLAYAVVVVAKWYDERCLAFKDADRELQALRDRHEAEADIGLEVAAVTGWQPEDSAELAALAEGRISRGERLR